MARDGRGQILVKEGYIPSGHIALSNEAGAPINRGDYWDLADEAALANPDARVLSSAGARTATESTLEV